MTFGRNIQNTLKFEIELACFSFAFFIYFLQTVLTVALILQCCVRLSSVTLCHVSKSKSYY